MVEVNYRPYVSLLYYADRLFSDRLTSGHEAIYGAGLWVGMHGFRLSSEAGFRRIAYVVIFLSAFISLPLWDGLIGR